MPFDGAGTYAPPGADFPVITLTVVSSTKFNNTVNDMSTGISNCVTRDGQSPWTGNIPAGGFRITGLGAGTARDHSTRVGDIQDGAILFAGTAGGTADALTSSLSPPITAYVAGQYFVFKSGAASNTGPATMQVNGIAAPKAIQLNGEALIAGDIEASKYYELFYDGTAFQLTKISHGSAGFTTGDVKMSLKTVADPGWLVMNDTTIGNAASGATGRANADTVGLFTLLWTNTADAQCAVSSGRGASAAADYAANKTIALPKTLGRALASAGTGSGLTARALALAMGAQDGVVVAHTHSGNTGGVSTNHTHSSHDHLNNSKGNDSTDSGGTVVGGNTGGFSTDHTHAFTTGSTGVAATDTNIQPTLFLNVHIKL